MKKQILTIIIANLIALALVGCNELKDSRDGKIYRTVKIGHQVWMAENLNYKMEDSYCYEDNPKNCKYYGRLYKWNAAFEACPTGWHLPSKKDFRTLFQTVGGRIVDEKYGTGAAKNLKYKNGWHKNGNGVDAFGFAAIPAGHKADYNSYGWLGYEAEFWSSTESEHWRKGAYRVYIMYDKDDAELSEANMGYGFSVRCLKD